jgi:hypothetical protein
MAATQDITQGIKVIKINKTDLEGNDNTLSLQGLNTLRLQLDDLGVVEFKIISISEQADYYTLFVEPNDIFKSKVIGSFLNLNSTTEGIPAGGQFPLTPGATATFNGYSIKSTTESSFDSLSGQIAPYYPTTCVVQVDYIVSQSSAGDQNPLQPYLSGSFGKIFGEDINFEGIGSYETHSRYFTITPELKSIPTTTNKDLAIETFTPAISSSDLNSNVYALSTDSAVFISQSEFVIDNNIIPDATLDTKADTTRTLPAGVLRQVTDWTFVGGTYYNFPGVNTLGPLSVTCSFDAVTDGSGGIGGNGILKIDLVSSERGIIATTSSLQGSSFPPLAYLPTTLSQSFYPISKDEQFYIQVSNTATGVDDISYRSGSWEINQAVTTQSLETLNIFSPFITEGNFSISDCNPLINNAVTDRVNEFYMDVDYSSNAIIAVNADTILSGSATRAKVQYSNYTTARITNPRYDGSRHSSPDINVGSNNQQPVIESEKIFFAYFDWIGGSSPERLSSINPGQGQGNAHVLLLIDEFGNTYQPSLSSSYYDNLTTVFNSNNNKANVVFRNTPTNTVDDISGVTNVIAPGAIALPILYTQTGSEAGQAVITMSFDDLSGGETIPAYTGSAESSGIDIISSGEVRIFNAITSQTGADVTYNTGLDYFELQTTPSGSVTVTPTLTLRCRFQETSYQNRNGLIDVYFQRQPSGSSSWTTIGTIKTGIVSVQNSGNQDYQIFNFTSPSQTAAFDGDRYRVQIAVTDTGGGSAGFLTYVADSVFSMTQTPNSVSGGITSPFWTVGSSNRAVLTGSKFDSSVYGGKQEDVSGSGYSSTLPLTVQVGDEIRFSANEQNVYQVISASAPNENVDDKLYLYLSGPVTSGTNLDSFLLRRYSPNPNFVLIETNKGGGSGDGFLIPEYVSPRLEARFDEIIADLEEKNII